MTLHQGSFLIDLKTYELRNSLGWTSHFVIYRDDHDRLRVLVLKHLGNVEASEQEALDRAKETALAYLKDLCDA